MLPRRLTSTLKQSRSSKKRKASSKLTATSRKKQKIETNQSEKQQPEGFSLTGIARTSKRQMSLSGPSEENALPLALNDRLKQFRKSLSARKQKNIRSAWDRDEELRAWFRGKKVNDQCIDDDQLIEHFKAVLCNQRLFMINAMWEENTRLQDLVQAKQADDAAELLKRAMSSDPKGKSSFIREHYLPMIEDSEVIRHVLDTLKNPSAKNVKKTTPYTISKSKANKIKALKQRLEELTDPANADIKSKLKQFRKRLSAREQKNIRSAWDRDEELRAWFRGKKVNDQFIDDDQLIEHFKAVLSNQRLFMINAMWKDNTRLHGLVQAQGLDDAVELLKRAMSSDPKGTSSFIREHYLPKIEDSEVIRQVLET